jgi:DNA-binding NarL/FixJ family response regulator
MAPHSPTFSAAPTHADPAHPARILLVGVSPLEAVGLRSLLERTGSGDIVAVLGHVNGSTLLQASQRPEVVIVDLPEADAVEAITRLCALWKGVPVLVIAQSFDYDSARKLVLAGARGVLTKDETAEHLGAAVEKVQEHELWLDRASVARIVEDLAAEHSRNGSAAPDPRAEQLTGREREIVELVAKGLCNKSIANELDISGNTVRHHLTSIFAKLGVHDRLALAVYAFRHLGVRLAS